jgi:HD-GYP domain-containing protein (c-di-GMP phosphodiesterase class II)
MTSDRPYREARPLTAALTELRHCSGTQFDPDVVAAVIGAQAATATGGEEASSPATATRSRARRSSRASGSTSTGATRIPTSDHA